LYLCQSARLGLAKLTGNGESRDNIVCMNLWTEKKCPSETAHVRSMIVWQVLVMKVGTLPLLHKNRFEFRIKSNRDLPQSLLFGQPHRV